MSRSFADARRWMQRGTELYLSAVDRLDEAGLAAGSALPDWTRRQLVAHVAANADALGNLVHWAKTGVETPMYASPEARAQGIEEGSRRSTSALLAWARSSVDQLEEAMSQLSDEQWERSIVTAQGRTVPATEIPWLRAREVCVHAVDLGMAVTFADLPTDFLAAIGTDIVAKRSATPAVALHLEPTDSAIAWDLPGAEPAVAITAPLSDLVAYLSGRTIDLSTSDGSPAPALPAWL
ncbi:maleylpyruvate isomerase family mycothiol-dependent enzyme [Nocardia sp. 348MFTsu5.1]|uniref:maleylpyruvate isomerase family mycothiol-dependent enzyme n=1 Tax=Nocardia sp. 348MFTsu5.1 TaxID=1172185 RepID=UPI00037279B2|nr:maleylpyruvate isomerase family mycothiol-dependent enzyme [Nocardia sp. 348MFTsu5.1]